MYYPLVGERVWVSGCRDEFIVARTDYTACVANLALAADSGALGRDVWFGLLFGHRDFDAAQAGVAARPRVAEILRSSLLCVRQAGVFMREMRETIHATLVSIQRSQACVAESDRVIERARTLDCKPGQNVG